MSYILQTPVETNHKIYDIIYSDGLNSIVIYLLELIH